MQDDFMMSFGFFELDAENQSQKRKLQLREGELREVTVLFADIKGFTSLSTRLQPEVIHSRMDELLKIFSRCITFYGGFVDKYIGDAIMALFGAKKASEQDTERAIRAGFKMLEQLQLYNSALRQKPGYEDVELSVRIGINTGMVSVGKVGESRAGDFTVYGPEVNLASRMESNAPIGRIMLPLSTKNLVEHIFEFEHLGLRELKGIAQPVDCWSPTHLRATDQGRAHRYGNIFVGRARELALLNEALDEVIPQAAESATQSQTSCPRPLIIGINAEAGLGKSRLVYEFIRKRQQDAEYIQAGCDGVSPTPLHLFARLLERRFGMRLSEAYQDKLAKLETAFASLKQDADASLKDALQESFPLIAWLLEIPIKDDRLRLDGKELLQHLQLAVNVVLEAIKQECARSGKPLVMVLDDLHWIDESSALALEHLIDRFAHSQFPSLLLLMYRPEFSVPVYMQRMRGWQEVTLKPMDEKDITELVLSHTRHLNLSERSIEQVLARSAGNPFYLEEWSNFVSSLPDEDWQDMPVPANLNALILSRLDALPQALKNILQKAAVIGQEFFVEILKEIERNLQEPVDIDSGLDSLEERSLILKQSGFEFSSYLFKHISTREVAYQTLLIANRKLLHQLTAEAIETLFAGRLDEFSFALGNHYLKADMPAKALPSLQKAAASALRVYDNPSALQLYQQVQKILPLDDFTQMAETLLAIIELKLAMGNWKDLEDDLARLVDMGTQAQLPQMEFHSLRIRGMLAFLRGNKDIAKELWDAAAALSQSLDSQMPRCMITNLLGVWHQDIKEWDEALKYHQTSLSLAQELADPQREAKSLNNLGLLYLAREQNDEALRSFNESLAIARQYHLLKDESLAVGNIGHAHIVMKEYAEAMPPLKLKLDLARRMNDKPETIKALGNISKVYFNTDRKADAIVTLEKIIIIKQYLGDEEGIKDTQASIDDIKAGLNEDNI